MSSKNKVVDLQEYKQASKLKPFTRSELEHHVLVLEAELDYAKQLARFIETKTRKPTGFVLWDEWMEKFTDRQIAYFVI